MKTGQKQLLLLFILLCVGIPALLLVQRARREKPSPADTGPGEEYALALVDRRGRPLSDQPGRLRVVLDPFTVYRNQPDQKSASFTTGPHGFRGGYDGTPAPIMVLGGSAAFGQGLPSDDVCFTGLLDGMIGDREVVNAAVVGFLAGQELALMVHRLDDFEPSMYVAFDGWNELFDQWLACLRREEWDHGFMNVFFNIEERLRDLQSMAGTKQPADQTSGISRKEAARRAGITKEMTHRLGTAPPWSTGPGEVDGPALADDQRELILSRISRQYNTTLGRMNDFARARGARFLVVFQPELGAKLRRTPEEAAALQRWCDAYRGYRELDFSGKYAALVDLARRHCAEQGIEYLDLLNHEELRNCSRRLFNDVVHLNEEGHRIAARLILERIVEPNGA